MYRLEEQIAHWRKEIVQAESLSQEDLSELEQHLRDSIGELNDCGLSQDEAFLIASQRLGSCQALAAEFGKVNTSYIWRRRVFWMLAGYIAIRLIGAWIGAFTSLSTTAAAYVGLNGTGMGVIAAGITLAGWLLLLLTFFLLATLGRPGSLSWISQAPTAVVAIGILAAIAVGVVISMAGQMMTARLVSAEAFGQSQLVVHAASMGMQLLIPLLCLAMMWSLRRHGFGVMQPQPAKV